MTDAAATRLRPDPALSRRSPCNDMPNARSSRTQHGFSHRSVKEHPVDGQPGADADDAEERDETAHQDHESDDGEADQSTAHATSLGRPEPRVSQPQPGTAR